ncbi:sugar transferase [Candidatus Gracilibacteria bacterium]|nr:sugar transferase [Candidatus Gracilibacteria bacterium]
MKKSEFLFPLARIINDGAMIFLGLLLAYFLRMRWFGIFGLPAPTTLFPLDLFYTFAFRISLFLVIIMALNGRYKFSADEKIGDEMWHIFWNFSSGMALLLVVFFFLKFTFFSRFIFGVAWLSGIIFLCAGRVGLRWIRTQCNKAGWGRIKILILGSGKIAEQTVAFLKQSPRFEVIGLLLEKKQVSKKTQWGIPVLGDFQNFEKVLETHHPDEVLVATENSTERITAKLVRIAHIHHIKFRFFPDELGLDLAAVEISTLGDFPLVTLQNTRLDGWGYVIKSGCDFFVATLSLALLSPVFAIIAWRVQKECPKAPILYASPRIGRNGRKFSCWKFRTMVPDADAQKKKLLTKNQRKGGILFKMENDPRVTNLGKVLRKWSLDELPQLWNVLRGEMSLIGPRPHLKEEVDQYAADDRRILSIKPGMTGFAQINGRSSLSFEEEMQYELFYLKNWSLRLDAIIFLKSVVVVLKRKNVS